MITLRNMIHQKKIRQAFSLILLIVLASCGQKKEEGNTQNQYDDQWIKGRELYLNNCTQCHIAIKKDEFFEDYMKVLNNLDEGKNENLSLILTDSIHSNIGIKLSKSEVDNIIKFIQTPQKKGAVN